MSAEHPDSARRGFFARSAALGLGGLGGLTAPSTGGAASGATSAATTGPLATSAASANAALPADSLRWLDGRAPAAHTGLAFGWPWPRGQVRPGTALALQDTTGALHPLQTWTLATWPDGSLKWSGHATAAGARPEGGWQVVAGRAASSGPVLRVTETPEGCTVDTGVIRCEVARRGSVLIPRIERGGVELLRGGRLVAVADDQGGFDAGLPSGAAASTRHTRLQGEIDSLVVEQRGPLRAVLRLRGRHRAEGSTRAWLPFDVRLYLHAGGDAVRVMHAYAYDGDPQRDFLRGLGLAFEVPLRDVPHDRHVRFTGEHPGLWGECVRGLTGLRRDPGEAARRAQIEGRACPPRETFHPSIRKFLERIPAWGDVTLAQHSPDSFQIKKRTQAGHSWVHSAWGRRASGLGYLGGPSGGMAFGLRDFWQRHPTQLDIRNAHTEAATVTVWMLSPEAPAQDLRPYHDGLGQHTFEQQLEGLEVTYEDWEPGFDTPVGVGRSSELTLVACAATPSRQALADLGLHVQQPGQLVASPQRYLASGVFGPLWGLPDRSTPAKAAIEDKLDFLFDFYRQETEQRRWTGYWDYGDVRHTYDADRHEWRYDVGGYAWDNSELSPDLWLWYTFLRSGRADVFRYAEAMVRHTSEVDTYHLGRFQGLGTRHGVQHWSDSSKQLRISTAAYRRAYYYLTADERIGDVLDSLRDADQRLTELVPTRKVKDAPQLPAGQAVIGVGTDWGSLLANWLTAWERSGDVRWRDKMAAGMRSVAAMPHGFFSASGAAYDPASGAMRSLIAPKVAASHLSAVFGLVEMVADVSALIDVPGFEAAWLQYCRLYNAPADEQRRELGATHGGANALTVGHSRLTAYAAWKLRDSTLARRAWREFLDDRRFSQQRPGVRRIEGPAVLRPVDEAPWISTNDAAQWSLAAIQNLALIGEHLPNR